MATLADAIAAIARNITFRDAGDEETVRDFCENDGPDTKTENDGGTVPEGTPDTETKPTPATVTRRKTT